MRAHLLLLGWLLRPGFSLAAQTEFGVDPCEYGYSLERQSAAIPESTDLEYEYCHDTTANLDSTLAAVYQRALARLSTPVARQALEQSEQAFVTYVTAQQRLAGSVGGDSVGVRRTMLRYRVFFLQKMLGEWTEVDEDAARATMKGDLRALISAEEEFFADSGKYTSSLNLLSFRPSTLNKILLFRLTPDGWVATIANAKTSTVCAVFIGSTRAGSAVKEGQPACR
jgi:hypothetical protein